MCCESIEDWLGEGLEVEEIVDLKRFSRGADFHEKISTVLNEQSIESHMIDDHVHDSVVSH
mgnify:CR=1 FL=1